MSEVFEFKSAGRYIITVDDYGISIQQKGILNALAVGITGTKQAPFTSRLQKSPYRFPQPLILRLVQPHKIFSRSISLYLGCEIFMLAVG